MFKKYGKENDPLLKKIHTIIRPDQLKSGSCWEKLYCDSYSLDYQNTTRHYADVLNIQMALKLQEAGEEVDTAITNLLSALKNKDWTGLVINSQLLPYCALAALKRGKIYNADFGALMIYHYVKAIEGRTIEVINLWDEESKDFSFEYQLPSEEKILEFRQILDRQSRSLTADIGFAITITGENDEVFKDAFYKMLETFGAIHFHGDKLLILNATAENCLNALLGQDYKIYYTLGVLTTRDILAFAKQRQRPCATFFPETQMPLTAHGAGAFLLTVILHDYFHASGCASVPKKLWDAMLRMLFAITQEISLIAREISAITEKNSTVTQKNLDMSKEIWNYIDFPVTDFFDEDLRSSGITDQFSHLFNMTSLEGVSFSRFWFQDNNKPTVIALILIIHFIEHADQWRNDFGIFVYKLGKNFRSLMLAIEPHIDSMKNDQSSMKLLKCVFLALDYYLFKKNSPIDMPAILAAGGGALEALLPEMKIIKGKNPVGKNAFQLLLGADVILQSTQTENSMIYNFDMLSFPKWLAKIDRKAVDVAFDRLVKGEGSVLMSGNQGNSVTKNSQTLFSEGSTEEMDSFEITPSCSGETSDDDSFCLT